MVLYIDSAQLLYVSFHLYITALTCNYKYVNFKYRIELSNRLQALSSVKSFRFISEQQQLITWRLKKVMTHHKISATDLAQKLGVSRNAVSHWRKPDMPKMNGEDLNTLLLALNSLRKKGRKPIQLSDLLVFSYTLDEAEEAGIADL